MRKSGVLLAAGLLASCSIGADVPVATQAATAFHHQLDDAKFAELYTAGSAELHGAASQKEWVDFLTIVHARLGKFQSASQTGWNDQATTGGHFITLAYQSKYEHGDAQEQLVYKIVDGKAVLTGYHVNSNLLMPSLATPTPTPTATPAPK